MKYCNNIVTDRQQVRINQWWMSNELNNAYGNYFGLLHDHVDQLVENWSPPSLRSDILPDCARKSYFSDSLMPRKNDDFTRVRMDYPDDTNGEIPDDYNDDARRARLTIPQWFASMLQTWTVDTLVAKNAFYSYPQEHSEHRSIRNLADGQAKDATYAEYKRTNKRPIITRDQDTKDQREFTLKLFLMEWPKHESLQDARKTYVGGMSTVFEMALNALPQEEEIEIRNNIRVVLNELEPSWRYRARVLFSSDLDGGNDQMLRITKLWFSELADIYLFGIPAQINFDYKTYIARNMHCGIREIFPGVINISNYHTQQWMRAGPENMRLYRVLTEQSDRRDFLVNGGNVRTLAPSLMQTIRQCRVNGYYVDTNGRSLPF